jgi:carbon monoxide dehydrogenase subunit G
MSNSSTYESRTGKLNYSAEEVYYFVTDIRNLKRFIPQDSISDLEISQDSCSFRVSMLGEVTVRITEKLLNKKIVFSGNALKINDFSIIMDLLDTGKRQSEFRITLEANMNPFLKMVAAEPVKQFLVTLVDEMEKFRKWGETI